AVEHRGAPRICEGRGRRERLIGRVAVVEVGVRIAGRGGREHGWAPSDAHAAVDRGSGRGGNRRPCDSGRGGAAAGPAGRGGVVPVHRDVAVDGGIALGG